MAVTVERPARTPRQAAAASSPVTAWATIGAVLLALETFILVKWVTGPNFQRVGTGPDSPPDWMKAVLNIGQVAFSAGCLACFYGFLVRPWLRERRVTIDGILCVGFFTAGMFDPLSNFSSHWFTYNSYLLNWGSPMTEIPGVTSLNTAGANQALSFPLIPAGYVVVFVLCSILGCTIMRAAKRRWPRLGPLGLIGICFACMALLDIVVEGLFFMRLGFWSYAGGHAPLFFGDTYYKYPLQVLIGSGIFFSVGPCLRYFVNDRGETLGERGVGNLALTPRLKIALRFLAVIATLHLSLLVLYHMPQAVIANSASAWPKDVQMRSYFTHGLCGPIADRACPGPGVPNTRPGAPYMDYEGRLVTGGD